MSTSPEKNGRRGHRPTSATTKQLPKFLSHVRHVKKGLNVIARKYPTKDASSCPPMDRWVTGSDGRFWEI